MNEPLPRPNRLMWLGVALTATLLLLTGLMTFLRTRLIGPALPVYGQVAEFTLTNQTGQAVSLADLRGKVWVADIIFTRCAGPCLHMSRQMKALQEALPASSQTKLVSLTTDPEYDSPAVLKAYAQRFGADSNRWQFLTGTKRQIARVASDSLKLAAVPKTPDERQTPEDLFIHSTIFVVVDKHGQLRGIYQTEGAGVDSQQVQPQILGAVQHLERES